MTISSSGCFVQAGLRLHPQAGRFRHRRIGWIVPAMEMVSQKKKNINKNNNLA